MPPRGGPEDKTPPSIVSTFPENGALNVPTDAAIKIAFSERVTKRSFEDAFFISPLPSEEIQFHWRGKKVKITFGDTLKSPRTYVVTIGAKSSDLRNNRMEQSYSIAFSTGPKIDEGQVSGHVFGKSNVGGTLICAYQIGEKSAPDPSELLADYYTQCNEKGEYQLKYMAPGKYRFFAIGDKDGDRKYTRGFDAIGVSNGDVTLSEMKLLLTDIDFQITVEDTLLPFLKSAYAVDKNRVDVRFNENIQPLAKNLPEKFFKISAENDAQTHLQIKSFYQDSRDGSIFHLITDEQKEMPYELFAQNIFDLSANPIDTAYNSVVFDGSAAPDTIPPALVFQSIPDSSQSIYPDSSIFFVFSEPVRPESVESHFHFFDPKQKEMSGKFLWKTPAHVQFIPEPNLLFSSSYLMKAAVDSIFDLNGNSLKDSVFSIFFQTMPKDTLTAIGGTFSDAQANATGEIHLFANNGDHRYHLTIPEPGPYEFKNILPGIYTIYAFRDEDGNGKFSFGKPFPFAPAERFVFYPDSVKVRSRWPNEGNDIILKIKYSER
ncbi:MAG: Ig-like domain-containing protein [Calditrichaeota bacterium]|nr:Ig-like domain-containing protein [Calditrichota bacterium]